MEIAKTECLANAIERIFQQSGLAESKQATVNQVRLRTYDLRRREPSRPFDEGENKKTLEELKIVNDQILFLEYRAADAPFTRR